MENSGSYLKQTLRYPILEPRGNPFAGEKEFLTETMV